MAATSPIDTSPSDEEMLRRAIELAIVARERGDHPFGALLVDASGVVVAEAMNSVGTTGDRTGHAERNLMSDVSQRFGRDVLAATTMYTSTEPCAMCAAAIYWAGVGRVVYGLAEDTLRELTGNDPENPTLALPCRTVFAAGGRTIDVIGPLLADEAVVPHLGFWRPAGDPR